MHVPMAGLTSSQEAAWELWTPPVDVGWEMVGSGMPPERDRVQFIVAHLYDYELSHLYVYLGFGSLARVLLLYPLYRAYASSTMPAASTPVKPDFLDHQSGSPSAFTRVGALFMQVVGIATLPYLPLLRGPSVRTSSCRNRT